MPENLAAALASFQSDLPAITKDKTAQVKSDKANYSYKYSDLASVTAAILPKLAAHGLCWSCGPDITDNGQFVMRWQLLHTSGEQLAGAMPLPPNAAPQALGGVLTYYRRYLLTSVTGCVADEDDDGQRAQDGYREDPDAWTNARPAPRRDLPGVQSGKENRTPAPTVGPDPQLRTEAQSRRMFQLLNQADVKEREAVLAFIGELVGRPVDSTRTLTKEEAGIVIASLEAAAAEKTGHDEQP